MRTPPLRRRVVAGTAVVVATVLLALGTLLYLSVRAQLEASLDDVLDTRLDIARPLANRLGPTELAETLTELGIPATVTEPSGVTHVAEPAVPRFGQGGVPSTLPSPRVSRDEELEDGTTITVFATRAGVEATLRHLLLIEVAGTAVALVAGLLFIDRWTRRALDPLRQVVDVAERTASGRTGERLQPDRPDTELGRLAVAFDEMLDALEAAVHEAQTGEERTQRFLADAAHQLRTPIAGIRASMESLLREDDPEARDRLMGNVLRETGRATRLLSGLLQLARLDRGRPPGRQPTDIHDLCRSEIQRAADLAPHLDVELVVDDRPDHPLYVDANALAEALGNLLDNARRHAATRIVTSLGVTDERVTIAVRDDGAGIDPEARTLVFERFATLDGRGGSGLGLPIARGVARAHGGDLVYAEGAFELSLPLAGPGAATEAPR